MTLEIRSLDDEICIDVIQWQTKVIRHSRVKRRHLAWIGSGALLVVYEKSKCNLQVVLSDTISGVTPSHGAFVLWYIMLPLLGQGCL